MSDQKSLVGIYESILETGWLITDPETKYVYRALDAVSEEKREPFILLDKQVALPTRDNLNNSGKNNLLIFHPLLEGLVGGESPVLGKLRRAYGIRFTYVATSLFTALLTGASHDSEISRFSPEQMQLLKVVGEADDKTKATWDKMAKLAMDKFGASNAFADVYTSKNGTLNGESYSRIATVRFPIYEELAKDEDKFFGSSLRITKSDRKIFMKLFEFMFSEISKKDGYSYGTQARVAPYLDALLHVFGRLFSITNAIYDLYHTVIHMEKSLRVELDWIDTFKDIESLKNLAQSVPQQYGNYPVKVEDEKRQTTGSNVKSLDIQKKTTIGQSIGQSVPSFESPEPPAHKVGGSPQASQSGFGVIKAETATTNGEFKGLGTPLNEANGVLIQQEKNLRAVMVDNAATRAVLNPEQALISAVHEVAKHGGVGRVSAAKVNLSATQANMFPQANLMANMQTMQNNNGWVGQNTMGMQQPQMSASQLARSYALQRFNSNPSPFASAGMFNNGSVI